MKKNMKSKNISLPKLFLNKRVKLKKKELKFIKTSQNSKRLSVDESLKG